MAKKAAEKTAKELSEMLLNPRKNGFFKVTDEKIEKADKFCEGYKAFLNSAKTERESVEYAVAAAEKHVVYRSGDLALLCGGLYRDRPEPSGGPRFRAARVL